FPEFITSQWQLFLDKKPEAFNFDEPYLNKEINFYFSRNSLPAKEKQEVYESENHFKVLLEKIENSDTKPSKAEDWFTVIKQLANLKKQLLSSEKLNMNFSERFKTLEKNYNSLFQDFLETNYSLLQKRSPFLK